MKGNRLRDLFPTGDLRLPSSIHHTPTPLILPDDREAFSRELAGALAENTDLIFTTGSTGLGSRDKTPDVAVQHMERQIPGIMELIRVKHGMVNPNAALSRSVAGLTQSNINNCL